MGHKDKDKVVREDCVIWRKNLNRKETFTVASLSVSFYVHTTVLFGSFVLRPLLPLKHVWFAMLHWKKARAM